MRCFHPCASAPPRGREVLLSAAKSEQTLRRNLRKQAKVADKQQKARALQERCETSGAFAWCRYHPCGTPGCGARFRISDRNRRLERDPTALMRHFKDGVHTTHRRGGGHAVGAVVSSNDRIVLGVSVAMVNASVLATAQRPPDSTTAVPADGFGVTLLSGRRVLMPPPVAGWACSGMLPIVPPTSKMYKFALWAASLKEMGKETKNEEAVREQARVGTADFIQQWGASGYVAETVTADGEPYFDRMELFEQGALKALLTKGPVYITRQLEKAEARERKVAARVVAREKKAAAKAAKAATAKAAVEAKEAAKAAKVAKMAAAAVAAAAVAAATGKAAPTGQLPGSLANPNSITAATTMQTLAPLVVGLGKAGAERLAGLWSNCEELAGDALAAERLEELRKAKVLEAKALRDAGNKGAKAGAMPSAELVSTLKAQLRTHLSRVASGKSIAAPAKRQRLATPPPDKPLHIVRWVQCDLCGKWRQLAPGVKQPSASSSWECSENTYDSVHNTCDAAEEGGSGDEAKSSEESDSGGSDSESDSEGSDSEGSDSEGSDSEESDSVEEIIIGEE